MGATTKIAWCDRTFNPFIGCTKVSPGCAHCYAETMDRRWGKDRWGPGKPRTRTTPAYWRQPLAWNTAAEKAGERHRVFCASLADVFDPEVPAEWRRDLWSLISATPQLDWLLLTKRPENLAWMLPWTDVHAGWPLGVAWPNIWLGTTVEDQQRADERIPALLAVPAAVRFLSCEPLLGPLDLSQWIPSGLIDWAIVGGESGPKARPFNVSWARTIIDHCLSGGVSCFVKQLGANTRTRNDDHLTGDYEENGWFLTGDGDVEENVHGFREEYQGAEVRIRLRDRSGADPAEWPEDLRVREFPEVPR